MKTIKPHDVVLGYTLKTRIGSGGYGEVWSAEAPGGMIKAVKFIYGFHDENRAKTELKSLDRIKLVRHPFLLSLERIQVVEGQLIVITELADKSLADLYRETKAASGMGIPRDELLQYMRDAADGLDYLAQAHSLQHLDVKPENLLLLSGHVKIADFGLVKEVRDATQSLMSGLTPIYAPPELFDGRPHRNSDQYSLAIVYQEMLTGARPFGGSSAAQLAAQHINSRPALQALPRGDQPVIARALSKDPNLRYESCRAMVSELAERKSRVTPKRVQATPEGTANTSAGTYLLEDTHRKEFTAKVSESKFPHLASRIVVLPPLDLAGCQPILNPTLIVGVGRTAAMAMTRIRQRLIQQFGPANKMPAIGFLCLDTDRQMLSTVTQDRFAPGLTDLETLPVPLKTPEQYRKSGKLKLNWISRRWIYNIPRSGQTEGLRPLGRLAFVDHASEIFRRLKDSVAEIIQPEAVGMSAETIGMNPGLGRVNVHFISSSAGGVGSGMCIDMAYAIRTICSELGVDDLRLSGTLIHCTPRGPNEQLLAIANSLSLLTEMRHINQYGYPGDESCGLPSFDDQRVFDDTYLMHLGDGLSAPAYEESVSAIGEYLFLKIATRCQTFFDACRHEGDIEIRSAYLRSFGLSQSNAFGEMSRNLAQAVMQRWLNVDVAKTRLEGRNAVESLRSERQLLCPQIRQRATDLARQQIEATRAIWNQATHVNSLNAADEATIRGFENAATELSEQLSLSKEVNGSESLIELRTMLEKQRNDVGKELSDHLWSLISDSEYRLGGALTLASQLIAQLQSELEQQREIICRTKQQQQDARSALKSIFLGSKKLNALALSWEQWRASYFARAAEQFESELAVAFVSRVVGILSETEQALLTAINDMKRRVDDCIGPEKNDSADERRAEAFPVPQLKNFILGRMDELVARVDTNLQHGWLHDAGGLLNVISDPPNSYHHFPVILTSACNAVMSSVQREISIRELAQQCGMNSAELMSWLSAQFDESQPQLADVGGEVRLLIGHSGNAGTLETLTGLNAEQPLHPTLLEQAPGDLVFCQELQKIPLTNLVYRMMERRAEALELVVRLHSRTDIDWTSLNELFQMC